MPIPSDPENDPRNFRWVYCINTDAPGRPYVFLDLKYIARELGMTLRQACHHAAKYHREHPEERIVHVL
jgi:hypothetical protein